MYKNLSDEDLIKLIATEKDKNAFNEIYKRYENIIYNYLNRLVFDKHMLDEIFQEVFIKVYVKAHTFKTKHSFKSWIYKISLNQYIDYYKKLKKQSTIVGNVEELKGVQYDAPDFLEKIIREENIEILKDMLNQLPEKYKQAIILKKIEGFKFDKVAEIMGVTSRSVKTYVAKGLEMLRKKFERQEKK